MANHYDVPSWAGKPPVGLHLDVMKGDKLIQKLMLDEKKCYLFGRNPQMNDFCIDHASCSRVHSALVYHKHLNRAFLVDLGSTHGTFIGTMRLEANKPTQLPIDSTFHFGASTRQYIIRERPQTAPRPIMEELEKSSEDAEGGLLGLPETETELDNLTEFNTAHNRRISMLGIADEEIRPRKRRKKEVTFSDEEEIINPEDVDPSVGRFRNLIQTTVIPSKRQKLEGLNMGMNYPTLSLGSVPKHLALSHPVASLYQDLPPESTSPTSVSASTLFSPSLSTKLGLPLPNPAPEVVEVEVEVAQIPPTHPAQQVAVNMAAQNMAMPPLPTMAMPMAMGAGMDLSQEPRKKKYAKEAWPGKKPTPSLLV